MLLCFAVSAAAEAGVYRCEDAEGNVTFSSFPCRTDAERVEVDVASGAAAYETRGLSWRDRQTLSEIERREERSVYSGAPGAAYSGSSRESAALSEQRRCESARAHLKAVRDDGRQGYDADWSRHHRRRVRDAKDDVRDACRPR